MKMGEIKKLNEEVYLEPMEKMKSIAEEFRKDMQELVRNFNKEWGQFRDIREQLELINKKLQSIADQIRTNQVITEEVK